jgi:hypothetical protein
MQIWHQAANRFVIYISQSPDTENANMTAARTYECGGDTSAIQCTGMYGVRCLKNINSTGLIP